MSLRQEIHFEGRLLTVDVTGEFSLEEAKRAFLETLEAVVRYQAKKVLLDCRNVRGNFQDFERFLYAEFAAKEYERLVKEHGIAPQFAYVAKEPLRDPQRFGENVAVNRGMNVKACKTPEEAFEWLQITPPDKSDAGDA